MNTDIQIKPFASDQIRRTATTLHTTSSGILSVYFSVTANSSMEKIGASEIEIQRYSGSQWITEKTLTTLSNPELLVANRTQYSQTVSYTPLYHGLNYRAVVNFYVKGSLGISTVTGTTNTVTA